MDVNGERESGDTTVYVEINSLEDWSKGKKLFARYELQKPNKHLNFIAMGVVEGGTKKGHTSLAFLLRSETGEYFLSELPLKVMETLSSIGINVNESFKQTVKKEEHN